jgi:hypothetical protein
MKILFTGMASGHTNHEVHYTKLGFFGVLSKVIVENFASHEIDWRAPSVTWTKADLAKYDKIFIGVIPPTSISANKVYGALHTIGMLSGDDRVSLVLDNPQLWQYKTSFASVARDPNILVSKFYEKRSEYKLVNSKPEMLKTFSSVCESMAAGEWADTIYPSLPWKSSSDVAASAGLDKNVDLIGINLDAHFLSPEYAAASMRDQRWVVDNPTTSWTKSMVSTVHRPVDSMKQSKKEVDLDIMLRLQDSLGAMVAPQDRGVGTWWTYRYAQALEAGTPIVTDWREAIQMSDSWGFLAYQIEEMSETRRNELAQRQKASYLASIPNKNDSLDQLDRLLNKKKEVINA